MDERNGSIKERLSARYGSHAARQRGGMVVLHGQRAVTVYGCRKILSYSPWEIRLCVEKRELSVLGEGLLCTCFSSGSATVEGKIDGVLYQARKQWGEDGKRV